MDNIIRLTGNPAVYTVAEAAQLLSLSRNAVYALVRSGEIPANKIGARWVIPKTRLNTWIDNLPEASLEDVARELATLDRAEKRAAEKESR